MVLNDFIRLLEGVREATACVVLGEKRTAESWFVPRVFAYADQAETELA